jgi:hypothetical protein
MDQRPFSSNHCLDPSDRVIIIIITTIIIMDSIVVIIVIVIIIGIIGIIGIISRYRFRFCARVRFRSAANLLG